MAKLYLVNFHELPLSHTVIWLTFQTVRVLVWQATWLSVPVTWHTLIESFRHESMEYKVMSSI